MFASMRARLTLWHTAVVGVLLVLFALAAYGYLTHTIRARFDRVLLEGVDGLRTELVSERQDQPSDRAAADEVVRELRFRGFAFVILDSTGAVVAERAPAPSDVPNGEDREPTFSAARLAAAVRARRPRGPMLLTLSDAEGGYRAAVEPIRLSPTPYVIAVVSSLHEETEIFEQARIAIGLALPIGLVLASLGGSMLARRSLAPMVVMRERAAHISASSLSERLPIATPDDEVGRLAGVINDLLARLEAAFRQQRQFMADASHELRTPTAVIQNESSLALSREERNVHEYHDALTVIRDAGRRLGRIVDDLFLLARADAGDVPLQPVPVYLEELIAECVRSMRSFAEARGLSVTSEGPGEAPFVGDEQLLHRLICNLLDNAMKHSAPGGRVDVCLTREVDAYRIAVRDAGTGVPPEVQAHVFERFVRADRARGQSAGSTTSGAGLGLAIVKWIAEAHGGRAVLASTGPRGSTFAVTLPLQPSPITREDS